MNSRATYVANATCAYGDTDEVELVERAKSCDPEAWGELYERFAPRLSSYVLYRVGNREVAADLVEDVFVRAIEHVDQYTHKNAGFGAWLFRIGHNTIVDHFRRQSHRDSLPLGDQLAAVLPDPEDPIERKLTWQMLEGALSKLTPEQREVILLRFVADLSTCDVAKSLGKPESAVKALQRRALAALKRCLVNGAALGKNAVLGKRAVPGSGRVEESPR